MIPYRVTMKYDRPPDVTIRAWRTIMKDALAEVGEHWHQEYLPQHFLPSARHRYHYRRRTAKYLQRKKQLQARGQAVGGPDNDLVLTGTMRDQLLNFGVIRSFPTRATLTMVGPAYITMRHKDPSRPHLASEATKVLKSEAKDISTRLNTRVTASLASYRQPRTDSL